jgi:hypothetical protein
MEDVNRHSFVFAAAAFSLTLSVSPLVTPVAAATATRHPTAATTVPAPPVTVNDLLPEEENVGTCIGTLERPGCGSKAKGDFRQYLTFAVLGLGLAFIGWRITLGIRQRDSNHTKPSGNTF